MNELLKRLANRALDEAVPETWTTLTPEQLDKVLLKFAEGILLECNMALTPYLRDMISRNEACDLINKPFGFE